jgi:autotransporter translocation and assembly factor TamB
VNGSASGTIALSSGQTQITLRSLVLNNKPLEDAALKGASKWVSGAIDAALQTMGQDDSSGVFLSRIDRVWIQDGLFHLKVGPYQGQK